MKNQTNLGHITGRHREKILTRFKKLIRRPFYKTTCI